MCILFHFYFSKPDEITLRTVLLSSEQVGCGLSIFKENDSLIHNVVCSFDPIPTKPLARLAQEKFPCHYCWRAFSCSKKAFDGKFYFPFFFINSTFFLIVNAINSSILKIFHSNIISFDYHKGQIYNKN